LPEHAIISLLSDDPIRGPQPIPARTAILISVTWAYHVTELVGGLAGVIGRPSNGLHIESGALRDTLGAKGYRR
jgi:hypothetical protein